MAITSTIPLSRLELRARVDAEFYSPEYISLMKRLRSLEFARIGSCAIVTSGSTPPDRDANLRTGILLLKTTNIRDGYIDIHTDEPFFIDEKLDERLASSRVMPKDVLINIVGATLEVIGRVAIVPDDFPRANITQAMSIIRSTSSDYLPEYVFSFLHSKFGRMQVCRIARPTAQYNLNHEETRSIIIPRMSDSFQRELVNAVQTLDRDYKNSIHLYMQAEKIVLEELRYSDFQPKFERSYIGKLASTFQSQRLDAEFFQPSYEALLNLIRAKDYTDIRHIQVVNRRGIQPSYVENGTADVIRSEHLGRCSIDYEHLDKTSDDEWNGNANAQVNQYDILTYTTGAYVGRTNCFLEQRKAIASNHVNILRIKELDPIYVSIFLNSPIGQLQLRRFVSGSAQPELYSADISKIVVWKPPTQVQEKIVTLVKESYESRRSAHELLEKTTRQLEQTIEQQIAVITPA